MRIIQQTIVSVPAGSSDSNQFSPEASRGLRFIRGIILNNSQNVRVEISLTGTSLVIFQNDSQALQSPIFPLFFEYGRGKELTSTTFNVLALDLAVPGADVEASVGFILSTD